MVEITRPLSAGSWTTMSRAPWTIAAQTGSTDFKWALSLAGLVRLPLIEASIGRLRYRANPFPIPTPVAKNGSRFCRTGQRDLRPSPRVGCKEGERRRLEL